MVETTKLMSVCLVTILLASLFLISGVSGTDTDSILSSTNDSKTSNAGNDTPRPTEPPITRFETEPIITGQIMAGSYVLGKYGATVTYDAKQGGNDPQYYPALVVKCIDTMYITEMKISVTGTKPDGNPMGALDFGSNAHLLTPCDTGTQWPTALGGAMSTIASLIQYAAPAGIGATIAIGQTLWGGGPSDGYTVTNGFSGNSAYTKYVIGGIGSLTPKERGYQYRFSLHCDPDMPGEYKFTITYRIVLSDGSIPGGIVEEFSQKLTYTFNDSPKITSYAQSLVDAYNTGGGGYVSNAGNVLEKKIDLKYANLYSGSYTNGATLIVKMANTPVSGYLRLYGYSPSANGGVLRVFVTNTAGVWTEVLHTNLYTPNGAGFIDCGYVTSIVNVAIIAYHEYSGYPSYINVDAVFIKPY
ncbi:hypothetical protein [Candidatus Bathycorpusculum sp.]|uniref:hypothetical protein n=1 Tax=Candidatus Bathycorpusculum sp. TaxID=2994959 RepID=UPI002823CEB0|nr:hypothetical protein [Candidatus Termitimicrobium sp.]MCL2686716.1 hypothetical protein [Candidatus Termitimicrobium sp.]